MPVQYGRNFLLQTYIGAWIGLAGLQSTSIALAGVVVDTTSTKSSGWREILNDCGNQTCTITASGIFKSDEGVLATQGYVLSHTLNEFRIIFEDDGSNWVGQFYVSKMEYTGAYNGARMYSLTIESSGQINFNS